MNIRKTSNSNYNNKIFTSYQIHLNLALKKCHLCQDIVKKFLGPVTILCF